MIFGIGTDIVSVERISLSLEKQGERFARRILTDDEYHTFCKSKHPAHFLAKRYAAKEAAAKAFGTGFSKGLSLQHISVINDDAGCPQLVFNNVAADYCRDKGINQYHLSLSDETAYAIAFVTLACEPGKPS